MKFWRAGILAVLGIWLCTSPPEAYGGASDTWAKHKKVLSMENNNWAPQLMTGPDSNGLYQVKVRLFPGMMKYRFGVVVNGTDTQYEPIFPTSSGYREVTVPTGVDTFYVPTNWGDTPAPPTSVQTEIVGDGQIKLTWSESQPIGLDVIHGGGYHVYYRSGAAGPPWTQYDTQLITDTTYTVNGLNNSLVYYFVITAIDAYDSPGVPATDSPAPPGPLMDTSATVWVTPQGKILVAFMVDMRQEIMKSGRPPYGMAIAGDRLTWDPFRQPLKEVSPGVYGETYLMQAGQLLEYKYVKNPGTSKQEWEGDKKQAKRFFRFDPATHSLSNVSAVYVRGSMSDWGKDLPEWRLYPDTVDGVYRLVKEASSAGHEFKYYVYHAGAPTGAWYPTSGGNLSGDVSLLSYFFGFYSTDTSIVSVHLVGGFDAYDQNRWPDAAKVDDYYAMKTWFSYGSLTLRYWTGNLPVGTYYYDFMVDKTNDGIKNGQKFWGAGNDDTIEITRNRVVYLTPNKANNTMHVKDVWSEEFALPKAPISVTAISDSGQVRLSWRKPSDLRLAGYQIYRDTDPQGKFPSIDTIVSDTVTEYIDTKVANGTTYYYKIATLAYVTFISFSDTLTSPSSMLQQAMPDSVPTARRMADGQTQSLAVKFQAGSLPADADVQISSLGEMYGEQSMDADWAALMSKFAEAENAQRSSPLSWAASENTSTDTDSLVYMIDVKSKTSGQDVSFDKAVTLTIPYDTTHWEAAQASGLAPKKMAMFVLNETTNRWEMITTSTEDPLNHTVSVPRTSFSIFTIMALAGAPNNLDGMVVYPNPVYVNRDFAQRGDIGGGQAGATFINIPTDVEFIKIYTITGELVRTLDPADAKEYSTTGASSIMIWDLKNDAGRQVASGVYIFHAKSATSSRRGKVAVVR